MRSARTVAVVLPCLLAVASLAVVAGAPPPTQLCGVCQSEYGSPGIDGATGAGTLDVYVDADGDSLWSARVPVSDAAADRYRSDERALAAAVDDAWARYHAAEGDVDAVESTVDGGAVVVNYTVADVARPGVGDAWLVDYFAVGTSNDRYRLAADRVTIHAPEGAVVTNRPPHADVDGNAATWARDGESASGEFADQTYVTYGDGGVVGTASGYAAIALETGPPALVRGLVVGVVPGALVGLAGAAVGRTDRGRIALDAATLERLLVAVGVAGAGGVLVVGAASGGGLAPGAVVLASLGVGYALLGSMARRIGARFGTRGLVGLAVGATAVACGLPLPFTGLPVFAIPSLFGLATALFLPIGYAFERGWTPVALLTVATLAPIAAATFAFPTIRLESGYSLLLAALFVSPWLVAVVVFGYPLALLGRRLVEREKRQTGP